MMVGSSTSFTYEIYFLAGTVAGKIANALYYILEDQTAVFIIIVAFCFYFSN